MEGRGTVPESKRKVGLLFTGGPDTIQETMEIVRLADAYGFDSVWAADDIGGRDPFIRLASWATVTSRIRLGVAVTNPYTRHPVSIAAIIATLDEASRGRAVLGLGAGDSWKDFIQEHRHEPLAMMSETIQMLREVWALPETSYRGVRVSLRDSLWVWPDGREAQFRSDIPIYIGATGPKMTALAGSRADGLVTEMSKFISEIENQARIFWEAARQAGREPQCLEMASLTKVSVVESEEQMADMRRIVAFEVARLPESIAEQHGFEMGAFEKIKTFYSEYIARGGPLEHGSEPAGRAAEPYVTQTMLDALAVTGDLKRCLSLMQRYAPAGVTLPLLIPLCCNPVKVVELGRAYLGS